MLSLSHNKQLSLIIFSPTNSYFLRALSHNKQLSIF